MKDVIGATIINALIRIALAVTYSEMWAIQTQRENGENNMENNICKICNRLESNNHKCVNPNCFKAVTYSEVGYINNKGGDNMPYIIGLLKQLNEIMLS